MGLRVGVDAVELDRVTRLGARAAVLDRVAADGERDLADGLDATFGEPIGVATLLALKEAVVKAVGGRPPGFSWRDVVVLHSGVPACPEAGTVLDGVDRDLLGGAAVHGRYDGHVVAAAVLWAPARRRRLTVGNTLPPPTQRELGDPEQVPA